MGSCLKQMYRYVHINRCRQYLEAMKQIIIVFHRAILTLLQIYITMNIICLACDKGYYGPNCVCSVTYCDHVNSCIVIWR